MAKMLCMSILADKCSPQTQKGNAKAKGNRIHYGLVQHWRGGGKIRHPGITAFAGKAYMLADGFRKERMLIFGMQETRSKEGGTSQIGDYHRISPDVTGQAAGDLELWFNTVTLWDKADPATVLAPKDAQIVATGPKFMIVHIGNQWIDMDVIVVHAPHS